MEEPEPQHPCVERTIALIYEAFDGVTREGGVSWSESIAMDFHESKEEQAAARLADKEACWQELVHDEDWKENHGVGGFCFLDPIGFRYYLAPAMILELQGIDWNTDLQFQLNRTPGFERRFKDREIQCICEFVKCMMIDEPILSKGDSMWDFSWRKVYEGCWAALDQNPI